MLGLRPNTTLRLGLRLKLHYFYFSDTLVMPETNIVDKAEQAEVNALAEATRRFMAKTGQTLVRPNRISRTPLLRAASFS